MRGICGGRKKISIPVSAVTGVENGIRLSLAGVVETAAGTEGSVPVRLTAIAQAVRVWALTNTHRYLLIYGTPVPGYKAPPEATALASRIFAPILEGFSATRPEGAPPPGSDAVRRSLVFWTRLHGVLSLEVAGHFTGMAFDPALLYAEEVESVVAQVEDLLEALAEPGASRRAPRHGTTAVCQPDEG
jgi:hypothetical protein